MMRNNKRAAIEFSVNVIVIMVVSIVILGSGLALFNKLRQSAVEYVEGVDSQTEAQLRAMMLNNNQKVSVYPTDITLERGKSAMVGLGIINTAGYAQDFGIPNLVTTTVIPAINPLNTVIYYKTPESNPAPDVSFTWFSANAVRINNESAIKHSSLTVARQLIIKKNVAPKEQIFKNILITVPDKQLSGLYVIKLNILNSSLGKGIYCKDPGNPYQSINDPCNTYGVVKIYVNVP